jgi:hypothetical protein
LIALRLRLIRLPAVLRFTAYPPLRVFPQYLFDALTQVSQFLTKNEKVKDFWL